MPTICPECKRPYDEKETGKRVDASEDARICHHGIDFEGGQGTGVWYIHGDSDGRGQTRYEHEFGTAFEQEE